MLSTSNIERLIAVKRREIEKEKTLLGLSAEKHEHAPTENKENASSPEKSKKQVRFANNKPLSDHNDSSEVKEEKSKETHKEFDDFIPADLERYIRRYIGLPVMLKAGEYSPNNPLVRGERAAGDALLGLGEYERRRNTLRKIRQQQYREYLDQQAKKKQEAKEQAERERREREQREREREERERELLQQRDQYSPDRRRSTQAHGQEDSYSPDRRRNVQGHGQEDRYSPDRRRSVQHGLEDRYSPERRRSVQLQAVNLSRDQSVQYVQPNSWQTNKVDTGVQVDGFSRPLSVAVQTDETELFRMSPSPTLCGRTQAERELSPRSVQAWTPTAHAQERRKSYGDYDERSCLLKKCSRDKLTSDLRHSYMPSLFDAEAIRLRNLQAEKEAAERRQFYQQELKNQILEQQRIREERKNREKMLEQAEMRRLEEQLRMLRVAQDRERGKQHDVTVAMKENTSEYNLKRTELQREIDMEQQKLLRATSQPSSNIPKRITHTSNSDVTHSQLPLYYPKIIDKDKKPYSMNIPDNSIFSSNYDVDSYLRKNLNFNKEKVNIFEKDNFEDTAYEIPIENKIQRPKIHETHDRIQEKHSVLIHEQPLDKHFSPKQKKSSLIHERHSRPELTKEPSRIESDDLLPIPVLKHSPVTQNRNVDNTMSDAMKKVDDKWKVPAVQKNILKVLPNEEGKNVSILTQLGSIRRQLQLEQMKLDGLLSKDGT